jgi:hypothetical protein
MLRGSRISLPYGLDVARIKVGANLYDTTRIGIFRGMVGIFPALREACLNWFSTSEFSAANLFLRQRPTRSESRRNGRSM